MNEPHDPNLAADLSSDPADPLRAIDPLATADHARGPARTDGSLPSADGRVLDLPAAPGYRVLGEIARGGMGRVLAARDLALDRDVALKVLLPGADADRFVRESKITARLPHPGIPPVHALGTLADGSPFLAMKRIAGQTLTMEMRTADRPRLLQAFTQVCQAVGFAHSRGVIHRDLKPANVMVGAFGEVQVMDWGLAKDTTSRDDSDQPRSAAAPDVGVVGTDSNQTTDHRAPDKSPYDQTRAGTVLGTPAYMAPEQARGEATDARADVFALGGILCAILTKKPPFGGKSTPEVLERAGAADLTEAFTRLDGCGADAELVALCRRCLSPNPADRPADGRAAADGMTAYLNGVQERLRAAERERAVAAAREAEQRKRRRVQMALAGAVVLLLLGTGAVAWWADRQAGEKRALLLQQQLETEQRTAAEKSRLGRNAEAVEALLTQAEAALRVGDAATGAIAYDAAVRRATEGGVDDLSGRFDQVRDDLVVLKALDEADRFRWTTTDNHFPNAKAVHSRLRAVLGSFGADPDSGSPDLAASRIAGSMVRDRLVAALDRILWTGGPSVRVRATLQLVDPHPVRDAVRDAVQAGDRARVADLIGPDEAADQPPGFAAVVGEDYTVPVGRRREILRAAVARRPNDLTLVMALGTSYPLNAPVEDDERLRWFQAAAAIAPTNSSAQTDLGVTLLELGDVAGAEAACRTAARLDPNDSAALNNLGNVLTRRKDLTGAEAAYREAVRLDPKSAFAHSNLGGFLQIKGDLTGSEASCRHAIGLDPMFGPAHANLGVVLRDRHDLDGAEAAHREALRLDPSCDSAHYGLGTVLYDRGDRAGAAAEYREAIRCNPRLVVAHFNLGVVLREGKDLAGAEAAHRAALRFDPKFAPAHNGLGNVLRDKGDLAGAVASFKEAIRFDPDFSFAHNNLGIVLAMRGEWDAAIAAFEAAIRVDPMNAGARTNLEMARKLKAKEDAKTAPPVMK